MTRSRDVADIQDNIGGPVPPITAGKNFVINGGFDVWQRGTSFNASTNTALYTVDRFQCYSGATTNITLSRQSSGLTGFQFCARISRNSGATATSAVWLTYTMETSDSIRLAGQAVTLSFWARAGANFSPTSSTVTVELSSGTGTDQNVLNGFTGGANFINSSFSPTTTWTRYTFTGTAPSNATQIGLVLKHSPTGTAGAADHYEIDGVQIEQGSVATPFSRAGGTIQGELAACYRYFQKFGGTQVNESFPYVGFSYSTTQGEGPLTHKGTMRTTPSLAFSTLKISDVATYNLAVTNLALTSSGSGPDASYIVFTVASGTSSGKINYMRTDATTAGYLYLSAEL
jgi:hypothetical protein